MAPIMAIGGLQKAMNNAPDLSWIIALAVFILLVVIAALFTIAVPRFKKLQTLVDKLKFGGAGKFGWTKSYSRVP